MNNSIKLIEKNKDFLKDFKLDYDKDDIRFKTYIFNSKNKDIEVKTYTTNKTWLINDLEKKFTEDQHEKMFKTIFDISQELIRDLPVHVDTIITEYSFNLFESVYYSDPKSLNNEDTKRHIDNFFNNNLDKRLCVSLWDPYFYFTVKLKLNEELWSKDELQYDIYPLILEFYSMGIDFGDYNEVECLYEGFRRDNLFKNTINILNEEYLKYKNIFSDKNNKYVYNLLDGYSDEVKKSIENKDLDELRNNLGEFLDYLVLNIDNDFIFNYYMGSRKAEHNAKNERLYNYLSKNNIIFYE